MRHLTAFSTVLLVITAFGLFPASAEEPFKPRPLSTDQLRQEIVGGTVRYAFDKDEVFEFYSPDGTVHGKSKMSGAYQGKWKIRDDGTFCVIETDPASSGCFFVVAQPGKVTYFRYDEIVEGPFDLISGNPQHL